MDPPAEPVASSATTSRGTTSNLRRRRRDGQAHLPEPGREARGGAFREPLTPCWKGKDTHENSTLDFGCVIGRSTQAIAQQQASHCLLCMERMNSVRSP